MAKSPTIDPTTPTTTPTTTPSTEEGGGGTASLEARLAALEKRAAAAEAKVAAQAEEIEQMESGYNTIVSAFRSDAPEETRAHVFSHLLSDAGHSEDEITNYLRAQSTPRPQGKGGGGKDPEVNSEIELLKAQLAKETEARKAAETAATQRQAFENRHLLDRGVGAALEKSAAYAKIKKVLGENAPKNFSETLQKEVQGATVSALKERLRNSGQQVLDPAWVEEEATKAAETVAGKFASIVDAASATSKVGAGSADADDLETLLAQKPAELPEHKKVPVGQGEKAVDDYLGLGMVQDLAHAVAEKQGGLIGS